MSRRPVALDIRGAQSILDTLKADQFSTETGLCNWVASEYNEKVGTPIVQGQLIKLRIRTNVLKLPFEMPKGTRGKQTGTKISEEHKKKMLAGRKTKSAAPLPKDLSGIWASNMEVHFKTKPNLLASVLRGSLSSCVKAMCINCMGGYTNRSTEDPSIPGAIRDCGGVSCPLYKRRPFQKKD